MEPSRADTEGLIVVLATPETDGDTAARDSPDPFGTAVMSVGLGLSKGSVPRAERFALG